MVCDPDVQPPQRLRLSHAGRRLVEQPVEQREHGRVTADAERERQDRHRREAGGAREAA
jgi:hypothetical protein